MKLLDSNNIQEVILTSIAAEKKADYIYMYPPRQTYRPISYEENSDLIDKSLGKFDDYELYIHFPFCNQICSFCNLYATVTKDETVFDEYVNCLKKEIDFNTVHLKNKKINTIYLGGGTPSILEVRHFKELFDYLEEKLEFSMEDIREVSMEVAPDTVEIDKFKALIGLGLTRVNLGVQSLNDKEVDQIGRKYSVESIIESVNTLKNSGLENLSVDLIYGLPNQSNEDWENSIKTAIKLNPDTICLYPFTAREYTGFAKYLEYEDINRYQKFDSGNILLKAYGYESETHVRWVKSNSNGGYIQKENHWALKNVFGIGAGARSYLWDVDKRNGYSVRSRTKTLKNYIEKVQEGINPTDFGILMTDDERKRKAVILNLLDLNRDWYRSHFNSDPLEDFSREFDFLIKHGFVKVESNRISLIDTGFRHRDTIVQLFFSEKVRELVAEYNYDE